MEAGQYLDTYLISLLEQRERTRDRSTLRLFIPGLVLIGGPENAHVQNTTQLQVVRGFHGPRLKNKTNHYPWA